VVATCGWAEVREGSPQSFVIARPNFSDTPDGTTSFQDGWGNEWTLHGNAEISNLSVEPTVVTTQGDNSEAKELAQLYKEATDRGTTCIFVLRDNVPMGCWAIWNQEYDGATQTLGIAGAELTSYFNRRFLIASDDDPESTITIPTTQTMMLAAYNSILNINDIGLIVDATLDDAVGTIGGDEPLVFRGTDGKTVGDFVRELSEHEDSFDYRVDIIKSGDILERWLLIRPHLGIDSKVVAKFTTNTTSLKSSRRGDLRANDILSLGGSQGPKRPFGRASSLGSFNPPLQSVYQLNDTEAEATLQLHANSSLDVFLNNEIVEADVVPSPDSNVAQMNPGDLIRIHVPHDIDPWFQEGFDKIIRNIGFTISVPDTGGEEEIKILLEEDDIGA
jgi:hypothetical protein